MRIKRFKHRNRRHNDDMHTAPFKDSNGATIKECRRKVADRRIDKMQAEWINKIMTR